MKHISCLLTLLFYFSVITFGIGQESNMIFPDLTDKKHIINKGSDIQQAPLVGKISPLMVKEDWNVSVKNISSFNHTSPIPASEFKKLKELSEQRRDVRSQISPLPSIRNTTPKPFLNLNFRGNQRGTSVPMDNSMAISKNGFIVSAINTNVVFTQPDGVITYSKGFPEFFTLLSLGTRMYDPRIIYDVEENRFIFMCLNGSDAVSTHLCIAFSETEDPNGNWFYYKIDGNPDDDDNWFDYPNISISQNDLYISGLMRNTGGDWQYSVLYQIDKMNGYAGENINWKHYNDLKNADEQPSFNIVPTPSGWNYLIGPGMYFVSNEALGGNKYNLYYTTGSLEQNPVLISLQTLGLETELAPNARQQNNANVLNTFDSRIWSALYLNGIIHMGSHVNTPNGDVGLFYGRFNIAGLKVDADVLITPGVDYAFPSFSSIGVEEFDDDILINYLYSGVENFAGQQQRICKGTGNVFEWSEPTTLKEGTSIIDALQDNFERWGDYTTSCRRFFGDRVETWVTGCYGETNSYGTWLGQFIPEEDYNTKTLVEFVADKTTTVSSTEINFKDITQHNPLQWNWSFEGGNPPNSTEKNPKVTYANNGKYNVQLIVVNDHGLDTLIKYNYIHIQDAEQLPIANFIFDKDTIFRGDTVQFFNMSSPNTKLLKWTFQVGSPGSSTEENPKVRYPLKGSYNASLTAVNIVGSDSKTVLKAVTVLDRFAPKADFIVDRMQIMPGESVKFTDKTTGGPTEWEWQFEGGSPAASSARNPEITYNTEGSFNVVLKSKNTFGEDVITKNQLIQVGQVNTNQTSLFEQYTLYPNPVTSGRVTLKFELNLAQKLSFDIVNSEGKLIKKLYQDKIKAGTNEFSFNTVDLAAGQYFLSIKNMDRSQKTIAFIVQ